MNQTRFSLSKYRAVCSHTGEGGHPNTALCWWSNKKGDNPTQTITGCRTETPMNYIIVHVHANLMSLAVTCTACV